MFTSRCQRIILELMERAMAVATKKTKRTRKQVKKEEKVDMGKVQSAICRDILDTADVTKTAVSQEIIEKLSNSVSREEIKDTLTTVNQKIDQQADQLVNRVIKQLK